MLCRLTRGALQDAWLHRLCMPACIRPEGAMDTLPHGLFFAPRTEGERCLPCARWLQRAHAPGVAKERRLRQWAGRRTETSAHSTTRHGAAATSSLARD